MKIAKLLKRITANASEELSEAEACDLFSALLDGGVPELELGALLTALAWKDVTSDELSGFYRAARSRLKRLSPAGDPEL